MLTKKLKAYVDSFNENDSELYKNSIDNAHAYEWLKECAPRFECPDGDFERTFYFRLWTFRKHVKETPEGYIISEFLPDVPWAGPYNIINAAAGHHIYEGRWLRGSERYLCDYVNFFLTHGEESHRYSTWLLDAATKLEDVKGKKLFSGKLDLMIRYYEEWERTHGTASGMFWSLDGRDAMEYSISGTKNMNMVRGTRPTLNSYMYAEALAIARFAEDEGRADVAKEYGEKAAKLRDMINEKLWDGDFYKPLHGQRDEELDSAFESGDFSEAPKEEIGYIPWMFSIPPKERNAAFAYLSDSKCFRSPVGYTTADMSDPRFLFEADHECLWNGYVWPFATSETLTALYTAVKDGDESLKPIFIDGMNLYAKSHTLTENGKTLPWIDEVMSPYEKIWTSREILKDLGWQEKLGGKERGKDYNHSTFIDLVISGTVGVSCGEDGLTASPAIPADWDYFRLENLEYRGKLYTVTYDKTGERYRRGKGLVISSED
ncbi:MAG: hypothetical protein IKB38_03745 [Clostridia bacterium]|nr:hypothetical protein [Clostridia bacterium]